MKRTTLLLIFIMSMITLQSKAQEMGTFTDSRDGHVYKTVKIGTQTWMAENLAFKIGGGGYWKSDDISDFTKYGYLYTWGMANKACPASWHLPTDEEWTILTNFLGFEDVAREKLVSSSAWVLSKKQAKDMIEGSNSSGFNAMPAGFYDYGSKYLKPGIRGMGQECTWWSSTPWNNVEYWTRSINYLNSKVNRYPKEQILGCSVRCIKEEVAIENGKVKLAEMTSDEALSALKKAKDKLDLGLITQAKYDSLKTVYAKIIK